VSQRTEYTKRGAARNHETSSGEVNNAVRTGPSWNEHYTSIVKAQDKGRRRLQAPGTSMVRDNAFRYLSFVDSALIKWIGDGFDAERSLFSERLDENGTAISSVPVRAMVQARQVYVFCDAARDGSLVREGEIALRSLSTTLRLYADNDLSHGVAYSIFPDNRIAVSSRDSYTQAFLLFALAAAHRLDGNRQYIQLAKKLDDFIETRLIDHVHGGLFTAFPLIDNEKRQNPLMHLMEAYLFLHEAYPSGRFLDKAAKIVRLFKEKMLRLDRGVLPEFFSRDWSEHPDKTLGQFFEPGHHFEWIWLLAKFDRLTGERNTQIICQLWNTTSTAGVGRRGCYVDAVDFTMTHRKESTRLWPHTEAIKAAIVMLTTTDGASDVFESALLSLLDNFLDKPFAGGWTDQLDANGIPTVDYVPASSLYHIYLASAELRRHRGSAEERAAQ
jgi:mannose/cellobiose epimerase-like protein (N-acyl-D-glucosamine 2-epimerase family)